MEQSSIIYYPEKPDTKISCLEIGDSYFLNRMCINAADVHMIEIEVRIELDNGDTHCGVLDIPASDSITIAEYRKILIDNIIDQN